MPRPPMDPRLAQIRSHPPHVRAMALVAAIAAIVGPNSKELLTKACQIRDDITPTAAPRQAIMHLMRMALVELDANRPVCMPFATWMDDAIRNSVPGMKEADPIELTENMMEFLGHLFGTDNDLGITHGHPGYFTNN